jgi:hypothetical protein
MKDKKPILIAAITIDETGQLNPNSKRKKKLAHLFDRDEE